MALELKLVMNPQLQQAIKILKLSLPELEALVKKESKANPEPAVTNKSKKSK